MNKKERIERKLTDFGRRTGCHQRPDRSFYYHGKKFPVCARCTGLWIGQTAGIILRALKRPKVLTCFFLLLPISIDGTVQKLEIKESTNLRRLITGILAGYAVIGLHFEMFRFFVRLFLPKRRKV